VPVLLLGVGVFVSAWQGWLPLGRSDPASAFARDVAALKAGYDRAAPDPVELKGLLNTVAAGVEAFPEQAAVARFHLGSGYTRLAELTAAPDEARGYWALAHQHFGQIAPGAEQKFRDAADPPRLAFRAAKARAAVGLPANAPPTDLALLLAVLSGPPPPGEEAGETHRLIADLALRQTPPDLARAKIALAQYVQGTGTATPAAAVARGRFRLGELYLQTNDPDAARAVLKDIGGEAPADVVAPAKALLARVLMSEANWLAAAKELEELRKQPGLPLAARHSAAYQLAVCRLQLREPEAARPLFAEAVQGNGPEARVAGVQLADVYLKSTDPLQHRQAIGLLVAAVKDLRDPKDLNPDLLPLNEVQAVFELAITTLQADGVYDHAYRAAQEYAAVSATGRDREKRAEVLAVWGAAMQKDKVEPARWKSRYKEAADEFAALAAFQPKTEGRIELLRRSAALARQAGEHETAAKRLEEAIRLPGIPDAVFGPLGVELADALLAAGQTDKVWKVLREVMASNGPMATATRYRLARQFVDSRHPGLVPVGRALFEQIATQQNVTPAEREFHERALTELANALIREGNFADAESRLRGQLAQYPNGPEAGLAKLLLGVCLLQRAAPLSVPTATAAQLADAAKMRAEAADLFKKIVAACDEVERRNMGKLPDREAWLRLQAGLRVLQTYQQMRTPAASRALIAEAATLMERHRGTVEELIIWSLVYHAFKQLNDTGKALEVRDRMRDVFDKLLPSAFPQKDGEYSRDYWLKVWFTDPK
jgi:tetratricopeptide (TPR) repeat protein